MGQPEHLRLSVWRGAERGRYRDYEVSYRADQTVLDLITEVQRTIDATLSYRFACRVGMCGSCAMTVNGRPRWTCRTLVGTAVQAGRLEVGPLRNLPVVKDLVTDMAPFFDKWQQAVGRFVPPAEPARAPARIRPDDPRRRAADAAIECIGCGICYAACDVVAWDPGYLGPAALNRAWTLINDARDAAPMVRLRAVARRGGCRSCHTQQSCADACPKALNPTVAIAGLKRAMIGALVRGEL
jgi:fumarate reductase iron-sulfur subunit